jgi:hypothetical protein
MFPFFYNLLSLHYSVLCVFDLEKENGGGELIFMLALRIYIDFLYESRKRDKL